MFCTFEAGLKVTWQPILTSVFRDKLQHFCILINKRRIAVTARTLRSSNRQSEGYPLFPMSKKRGRDCPGFPQCFAAPVNRSMSLQQRSPRADGLGPKHHAWFKGLENSAQNGYQFYQVLFHYRVIPTSFLMVSVVAMKKLRLARSTIKCTGLKAHSRHRWGNFMAPPLLGST